MKNYGFVRYLFLTSFLLFSGCEGSKYPISGPEDSIVEEGFFGTWRLSPPDGEEESYLNIMRFNQHEYYGEAWEAGGEEELLRFGIHTTTLNGVQFANVRCILCDEDDGIYFFFKYELVSEDELVAVSINDDLYDELSKLESTTAVRSFLMERIKDAEFFDSEEGRYRKLEDWVAPWQTVK